MEKADQLFKPVDWIFDDLLNQDSKPERIELRHVIAKYRNRSHDFADLGSRREMIIAFARAYFPVWD